MSTCDPGNRRRDPGEGVENNLLVGAWKLLTYEKRYGDGQLIYPFGPTPSGLLIYSAQGTVSAQFMTPERPLLTSPEISRASDVELAAVARNYFSYAGTYSIDMELQVVYHEVVISLVPNLVGKKLCRDFQLDWDQLHISHGKDVVTRLLWRRWR